MAILFSTPALSHILKISLLLFLLHLVIIDIYINPNATDGIQEYAVKSSQWRKTDEKAFLGNITGTCDNIDDAADIGICAGF